MSADFIYVIEARNGLVKIGCSRCPRDRVNATRLYSPVLVRLVAQWRAPRGVELRLHARFDALRSHKEWFRVEGHIVPFLEGVWGRGVEAIDSWSDLTFREDGSPKSRLSLVRSAAAKARWADPAWAAWSAERQRIGWERNIPANTDPSRQMARAG